MKLKTYLNQTGQTAHNFAERVGCTSATVSRLLSGKRFPSPKLMRAIERATDGNVRPNDFFSAEVGGQ